MGDTLVPISRSEFYSRIGLLDEVDPLTTMAYRFYEEQQSLLTNRGDGAAHDWHVSFHGSEFPGAGRACGRKALYTMMDMPKGLFNRQARQIMEAGKDIETRIVDKWWRAGYLVSANPHGKQTEYEDPEIWLTSTVDAIVVWPRSVNSIVVEIKTKYAKDLDAMRRLLRGPDEKHVLQIKTQLGLAHEAGPQLRLRCGNTGRLAIEIDPFDSESALWCPAHKHADCLETVEIAAPDYGFIHYASRDNPMVTHSFFVEYDPEHMRIGREALARWREHFINDKLPQTHMDSKRYAHPFGWLWGDLPCKWCDHGEWCRKDMKASVEQGKTLRLSDSIAVEEARYIRPDYDLDLVRQAIAQRWGEEIPAIADLD